MSEAVEITMSEFYKLFFEVRIDGAWYLNEIIGDGKHILGSNFLMGKPFDVSRYETIVVEPNVEGNPVDYRHTTFNVPIVSKRFADVVERFEPTGIQRIPVTVLPDYDGFEILNILKIRECVDLGRTYVKRYDNPEVYPPECMDQIHYLADVKILTDRVRGDHIFRLQEWSGFIVISESLRNALQKHGFTGTKFTPVT